MTGLRPILFGEVLFDHFADGSRVLGGAPLNVAVHLAGLGEPPILVSRVGADDSGATALAQLRRRGVDTRAVQVDRSRPTGEVRVEIVDGEPDFDILERRAWDAIDGGAAVAALRGIAPGVLYHGVLAARAQTSRQALLALRDLVPGPRFVDLNLRPPWTPIDRALDLARGATWLKLNTAELEAVEGLPADPDPEPGARRLLARTGAANLVVTQGERGATLFAPGRPPFAVAPQPQVAPAGADPVGAGDAFAAVLLAGALRGWPAPLALERAANLAAAVCALRGALPSEGGWHRRFRERWGMP